jgi:hypothetical protein
MARSNVSDSQSATRPLPTPYVFANVGCAEQKSLAPRVDRILLASFAAPPLEVVWPHAVAFSCRHGGPTFVRHYSRVLSLSNRCFVVDCRAQGDEPRTKHRPLLSAARGEMRAKTPRSKVRKAIAAAGQ